jgi:hypothetical protein
MDTVEGIYIHTPHTVLAGRPRVMGERVPCTAFVVWIRCDTGGGNWVLNFPVVRFEMEGGGFMCSFQAIFLKYLHDFRDTS